MFERFTPQKVIKGQNFSFNLPISSRGALPLEMIWVEPGTFMMGKPEPNRELGEIQFQVTLTDGYWLSKYPITFTHWGEFIFNPKAKGELLNMPKLVSWYDALVFCWEIHRSLYEYSAQYDISDLLPEGYRFRLPTEAQWEYACRAGTSTQFYNGDDITKVGEIGWHKANNDGKIHPAGEKLPNAWGFHDMVGNIYEWCWDIFEDTMSFEPKVNWVFNDPDIQRLATVLHVVKGGSWEDSSSYLASFRRTYTNPYLANSFRICLSNHPLEFPPYMR